MIGKNCRRPKSRRRVSTRHHGGRAAHPQPPQAVLLRGRSAHHDHPALLPPHQAVHGRAHAHQRGNHFICQIQVCCECQTQRDTASASSPQRQRLSRSSKHQRDGEAATGSRKGSPSNDLKRSGSCSLENGGGRPGIRDAESGDKPGAEGCRPEEEDDDEDGIFNPVRMPGIERRPLSFWKASN